MAALSGGFATATPRTDLHVIRVAGVLDTLAGARLLRLIDARLRLLELGHASTRHILIDLTVTRSASTAALDGLKHAAYACRRHRVGLHLVGTGRLLAELPAPACHHLTRISCFPTLEAAQQSLHPPHETSGKRI